MTTSPEESTVSFSQTQEEIDAEVTFAHHKEKLKMKMYTSRSANHNGQLFWGTVHGRDFLLWPHEWDTIKNDPEADWRRSKIRRLIEADEKNHVRLAANF